MRHEIWQVTYIKGLSFGGANSIVIVDLVTFPSVFSLA